MNKSIIDQSYHKLLNDLKASVSSAKYKAALHVNKSLVCLYHHIGSRILHTQVQERWGAGVIAQLSKDLRASFPEMKGFSTQNLKYMRKFAQVYDEDEISQQAVDQIPWGHIVVLIYSGLDKIQQKFYIEYTIKNGWSRSNLSIHIETNLYERQSSAITNFDKQLSPPHAALAQATLKNPYLFDFLSLGDEAHERELEKALVAHIEKFLLELGEGFAFLGRQYHLQVQEQDFYIDLLFYHVKIHSFIVIDLKSGDFKPEYVGKMNFYLSAVDDLLRHSSDNPSIGLILCRSKVGVLAEYTLRDINKPIGLSTYRLTKNLPEKLQTVLPTIEELEAELAKGLDHIEDD